MRSGISWAPAAAAALFLPSILVASSSASAARDGETCDGKPATIVVSEQPTQSSPRGYPLVSGTDGDDVIVVTYDQRVVVDGGAGDDTICGSDVGDLLYGGDGNDTIVGGAGPDWVSGGEGDNILEAGGGNDYVADDAGNDSIDGGPGNDTLAMGEQYGIPDDNEPFPGPCPRYDVHPVVDVGAGTVTGLGDDTFHDFESYSTGWYDSTLLGGDGPDNLSTGFCGQTVIDGRGGDDHILANADQGGTVSGGAGDDHIVIGSVQVAVAGAGDDTVVLSTIQDMFPTSWIGSQIDGGRGRDLVKAYFVNEIDLRGRVIVDYNSHGELGIFTAGLAGFEDATLRYPDGSDGTDPSEPELIGTSGPNTLRAVTPEPLGPFPTVLKGLAGNDRVLGGPQDTARGGLGHDICRARFMRSCEIRHRLG
jgi:Ca2+-binding RTX toxin-like protein